MRTSKRVAKPTRTQRQVKASAGRLASAFETWAWSLPDVIEIVAGVNSVIEGTDIQRSARLWRRRGYAQDGLRLFKERPA